MRMAPSLGLTVVVALLAAACGDASSSSGSRLRGGYVPVAGEPTDHDPNDVDTGSTDPGNPNATTPPSAPTTAGANAEQFGITLSTATPAVDLGADVSVDVSVSQKNGFTGPVELAATGLPAGVTATFSPATVTVGAAPVTAKLVLAAAYAATPSAPNASSAIQVVAKSGQGQATANANFKVNPRMTLTIPMNVDALRAANVGTQFRNEWGTAFGAAPAMWPK